MNKNYIFDYIKTIFLTILVAFVMVIIVTFSIEQQVIQEQPKKQSQEQTDDASIQILISKNQYFESLNPKNYMINFRLGVLFELRKDYKNAEIEYQKSISKAPFGEYRPQYRLALLYVILNRLDEAQALMDNLGEHPDKKLIKFKAEVFEKIGDAYFNQGEYDNASFEYQKSLFYLYSIKSKHQRIVKGSLASSYMYLADQKVKEMEMDQAINYLQLAKSLVNAPIIKYRLAVLLTKDQPGLAYQYFDEVFKESPEILNFVEYNRFLNDLAQQAEDVGEYAQADLYDYKIKKLKEYFSDKILCFDDLQIEQPKGVFSLNFWRNKYHITFDCKLKNISTLDIKSLFLTVVFETKGKELYKNTQQIFDEHSILKAGKLSPLISINSFVKIPEEEEITDEMTAKIYVSKLEDSSKIFLQEINMEKKKKKRMTFRLFGLKFSLPLLQF